MKNSPILTLLAGGVLCAAAFAQEVPTTPAAPAAPQSKPAEAKKKAARPNIYDEKADAKQQIADAVAKAKKDNRRVLLQWGANWCGWCHLLHDLYKNDKAVAKELLYEYNLVLVDVGQFDKHMELAKELGADLKGTGLPYLTILDADGKALANQETGSLESKDKEKPGHDSAKVMEFLKKYETTPVVADEILKSALAKATKEGKTVFLHFGTPWCGWCRRLEKWMARPEVATVLDKDFVCADVDIERAKGGEAMIKKYCENYGGPPWFNFLSADGKEAANSMHPVKGNVGFPQEPHEIEWFMTMLGKVKKNLTDADLAFLKKSLEDERRPVSGH